MSWLRVKYNYLMIISYVYCGPRIISNMFNVAARLHNFEIISEHF